MQGMDEIQVNAKVYYDLYTKERGREVDYGTFLMGFCNGVEFFALKHEKLIKPRGWREKLEMVSLALGNLFK